MLGKLVTFIIINLPMYSLFSTVVNTTVFLFHIFKEVNNDHT